MKTRLSTKEWPRARSGTYKRVGVGDKFWNKSSTSVLSRLEEPDVESCVPGLMNFSIMIPQFLLDKRVELKGKMSGSPRDNEAPYRGHDNLDAFWGKLEKRGTPLKDYQLSEKELLSFLCTSLFPCSPGWLDNNGPAMQTLDLVFPCHPDFYPHYINLVAIEIPTLFQWAHMEFSSWKQKWSQQSWDLL